MMLGSPCSPCCDSCTLPAEIPVRFTWSLASVSSYRWLRVSSFFSNGYIECQNTAFIGVMSQTPASLFTGSPFSTAELTLTPSAVLSGGTVRDYSYRSSYRLSSCCNQAAWDAWVARVPGWRSDNPTWRRLGVAELTLSYSAQLKFYAKEYPFLTPAFDNAISVIQARGDLLPGTPCGLAEGQAILNAHVKYENGECHLYSADFQIKGTASSAGVPYPEDPEPWPQDVFSAGQRLRERYVAYGIQGGRVWLSSDLELQFSAASSVSQIETGSYMYVSGANRLGVL